MGELKASSRKRVFLPIISAAVTLAIITCGVIYFRYSKSKIMDEEFSILESIAKWKMQQLNDWREEQKYDFEMLRSDNFSLQTAEYISHKTTDSEKYISSRFESAQRNRNIHRFFLLDSDYTILLSTNDASGQVCAQTQKALLKSKLSNRPIISDFFICPSGNVNLDVVGPIYNDQNKIIAYLVMRIDVDSYFYPLIQSWPLESDTAENLIFTVEEGNILFLNELRHQKDTALKFTIPLTNKNLPAVQLAEGAQGVIIGNDYRGIKTLAFGSHVPETDWYLLSKIDYSEAFEDLNSQLLYIALIIALLLVLTPIVILFFVKNHDYNVSKKLYQSEMEKNRTYEFFRFVINSVPQRIFWKDKDFRYIGCNTQFASDMGFSGEEEIIGKTDYDFFPKNKADEYRKTDVKVSSTKKARVGYEEPDPVSNGKIWLRKNKMPMVDSEGNIIGVLGTYEDVTRNRQIQEELDRHVNSLQTVYENLNAVLFSFSSSGTLTFLEGKLLDKMGLSQKEGEGKNFMDVFASEKLRLAYNKSLSGEDAAVNELEFSSYVLNFIFQPVLSKENDVKSVYGLAVDVTDLHRAILDLQRSNKELEQFAYVASHDLQEPLRMVSNFTQLLEKKYSDKLDDDAKKYIFYSVDGAKRMQILINDLLNYSRINTRSKEHSKVDMNAIMAQVKHNMADTIEKNNAIIVYDTLPTISAEPTQMYQMMQNLISNSIKFRKSEDPIINISCTELPAHWRFEVKDNGIGIEEKYKDRIFQIFQRLYSRLEYEGTGIGLALCQRIAQKHGGDIWFESVPGEGTSFYFTINKNMKENMGNDRQNKSD